MSKYTQRIQELDKKNAKIEEQIQKKQDQLVVLREDIVGLESKQKEARDNISQLSIEKEELEKRIKAIG